MGQLRRRAISARHAPGCSACLVAVESASPKLFVSSNVARPPSDDESCAVGPFLRAVTGTWGSGNLSLRHQVGRRLHDTGTPTRTPAQMPQRIEPPGGYRLPRSLAHATTGRVIRCAALRAIYVSAVVHCSVAEARALASLSLRAIAVNPRANPRSAPSVPLPALTHRQTQAPWYATLRPGASPELYFLPSTWARRRHCRPSAPAPAPLLRPHHPSGAWPAFTCADPAPQPSFLNSLPSGLRAHSPLPTHITPPPTHSTPPCIHGAILLSPSRIRYGRVCRSSACCRSGLSHR
jgi:hypothetical protein